MPWPADEVRVDPSLGLALCGLAMGLDVLYRRTRSAGSAESALAAEGLVPVDLWRGDPLELANWSSAAAAVAALQEVVDSVADPIRRMFLHDTLVSLATFVAWQFGTDTLSFRERASRLLGLTIQPIDTLAEWRTSLQNSIGQPVLDWERSRALDLDEVPRIFETFAAEAYVRSQQIVGKLPPRRTHVNPPRGPDVPLVGASSSAASSASAASQQPGNPAPAPPLAGPSPAPASAGAAPPFHSNPPGGSSTASAADPSTSPEAGPQPNPPSGADPASNLARASTATGLFSRGGTSHSNWAGGREHARSAPQLMRLELVRDVPYTGYCDYLTNTMRMNADQTFTPERLKLLVLHEAYPGHDYHLWRREYDVHNAQQPLDSLLVITNTPSSPLFEGIGDNGAAFLDWLDPTEQLHFDLGKLRSAACVNACLMLHEDNAPPERVREFLIEEGGAAPTWAATRLRFMQDPLRAPFVFSYYLGYRAVAEASAAWRGTRADFFTCLYGRMHSPRSLALAAELSDRMEHTT